MIFEPRACDLFSPPAPAGKETAVHPSFVEACLSRACAWLVRYNQCRRQRMMLCGLDDRLLSDIGLSRADIGSETERYPWQL